jgi:hypothetical protein
VRKSCLIVFPAGYERPETEAAGAFGGIAETPSNGLRHFPNRRRQDCHRKS